MVIRKIHKWAGIFGAAWMFVLALTGFFLNHKNMDWLWRVQVPSMLFNKEVKKEWPRYFEAIQSDPLNTKKIILAGRTGIYLSEDSGKTFRITDKSQTYLLRSFQKPDLATAFFAGSSNGILISDNGGEKWRLFALEGKRIDSINIFQNFIYAVSEKRYLWKIDIATGNTESLIAGKIPVQEIPDSIALSRLVRDLHYARGYFSGIGSLFINDTSSIWLVWLTLSGMTVFILIYLSKRNKISRNMKKTVKGWMKMHSLSGGVFIFIPVLVLLITGILIDHPDFLKSISGKGVVHQKFLPPVYRDLSTDIWNFDFDGKYYRIGNRMGVYASPDLQQWKLDSAGFSWKMRRDNHRLHVFGMGSSNRVLENNRWTKQEGHVHMIRDFTNIGGKPFYLHQHSQGQIVFPDPENGFPVYFLMVYLHNGLIFHKSWVWINDLVSVLLLMVMITGIIRWVKKREKRKKNKRSRVLS